MKTLVVTILLTFLAGLHGTDNERLNGAPQQHGATAEESANKEQSTNPTSEAAIHVKAQSIDGDTHELDIQPCQTVAEVKRTLDQQTGAPAHQQQLFLVPAEGADSDVHAEQLPDAKAFAELQEHVGADRTLQLCMFIDPSAARSELCVAHVTEIDDNPTALYFRVCRARSVDRSVS